MLWRSSPPGRRWAVAISFLALAVSALAQDMMRYVDVNSPEMTSAEMTRAQVEAALAEAKSGTPADFTGKKQARFVGA
jgi:hypothetical protein